MNTLSAVYFLVATLTTVGYGDLNPLDPVTNAHGTLHQALLTPTDTPTDTPLPFILSYHKLIEPTPIIANNTENTQCWASSKEFTITVSSRLKGNSGTRPPEHPKAPRLVLF